MRNGSEDELDANGDVGTFVQAMTSAKKSPPGPLGARGAWLSSGVCRGTGGANASTLETLCAWGRLMTCGAGCGDTPSLLGPLEERPSGIERVLRRRLGGGERTGSTTGLSAATGVTPAWNTGRKEWTDMRDRRLPCVVPVFGEVTLEDGRDVVGGPVDWRSAASCVAAAGADNSRCLLRQIGGSRRDWEREPGERNLRGRGKTTMLEKLTLGGTSAFRVGSRTR